jgi:site-specific DNA-methyltransferase (adenine-specific)
MVYAAMKPGAHLLAFGGSRTYHRLACAVENAGFEIRDQIMWIYGNGFPKSLDVSKALDKKAGRKREIVGPSGRHGGGANKSIPDYKRYGESGDWRTAPATDSAKEWEGWGTALKPAHEPIVVARKPVIGTVAENVLIYGTGALNIDGCRIPILESLPRYTPSKSGLGKKGIYGQSSREQGANSPTRYNDKGRWPANVIHDGLNEGWCRYFYCPKATTEDRGEGNHHPTVKPSALMRYLCRLVTPPGGIVLDPFMGSGSTGKAALLEGFRFVGIESDTEQGYFAVAKARIGAV